MLLKRPTERFLRSIGQDNIKLFPHRKKRFHKKIYIEVAQDLLNIYMPFMNYGFGYIKNKPEGLPILEEKDKPWKYGAQLYYNVTSPISLENKHVLEIGSGRGGGCYYMKKYLKAGQVDGIDFIKSNVEFAAQTFPLEGISFIEGDAEKIPFESEQYDAVVNVESSHCYPNIEKFYSEVIRVLKPGCYFFYTDIGDRERIENVRKTLKMFPFSIIRSEETTQNALKSLEEDDHRKRELIKIFAPNPQRFQFWLNEWGLIGSPIYHSFKKGDWQYWSFALRKDL